MKTLLKIASREEKIRSARKNRMSLPKELRKDHARMGNILAMDENLLRRGLNRFNPNAKGPGFNVE